VTDEATPMKTATWRPLDKTAIKDRS